MTSEQVARYLNAPVCDIGEDLISQLLNAEHCTTPKDQKEFVSDIYEDAMQLQCFMVQLFRMNM